MSIHGKNFLMVPGPTNVPDRVLRAMHRNSEDHRSPDFPALAKTVLENIKWVFGTTKGRSFIFPASGTGAWEAALTNTLNKGDKVISVRFGQFSHLWIDMMQRLGLEVTILDVDWGEGIPIDILSSYIAQDTRHEYQAVCVVHNETTTGVTTDIAAVRNILDRYHHPALLMVDGVSSIASIPFKMDEWKVDLAITGSQKGLMLPAGLGMVCASEKALERSKKNNLHRVFFSFEDMIVNNDVGYFPYTPSIPLLYGLKESLAMLMEEGLESVYVRHRRLAHGVRRAVEAWGLKTCCKNPKEYSDTVTAVVVPEGFDAQQVIRIAYEKYNLSLGAGLMKVRGRVFRIGHLGDLNELMVLATLAGTEMAMLEVGIPIKLGSGVAAASEYYMKTSKQVRGLFNNV
ncbi:serine--glyoxylate transaminase [Galdieria sulphuraria]|uniref:alanine--glyoxylate transaminase n=1 Tax=Galdieria sulphuraria TaxID=130081 RepID=M2Y9J6_GALSU|nr:serine--glyoxylate transaminase [Galdieria sulphuraria]EME32753.1 serine--glyoxylate transaminase [Galdieria sulphuraria]|eukprot:XP_005709273.1 serine--glyoxylate transaminase [Galdieria sulphuraria]